MKTFPDFRVEFNKEIEPLRTLKLKKKKIRKEKLRMSNKKPEK